MENQSKGVKNEIYLAPEKESNAEESAKENSDDVMQNTSNRSVKVNQVSEIRELRDKNRKVFLMSDGTEQAVFFPSDIHVFDDETHGFEEMDDSLTEDNDGKYLVAGKHPFTAKFNRESSNDELFSMEEGMHKVTVFARKNKKNKNSGVVPGMLKKKTENTHEMAFVSFEEIEKGSDYEYHVMGDGVKENIVVKCKADVYRYPFTLFCENVLPRFDEEEKRVSFTSIETGNEVFFIPAPFMQDANGIVSTAVSYELKVLENGVAHFTVSADSEFINAEKRAFPVIIDPQIKLTASSAMTTYSWDNGHLYISSLPTIGTSGNGDGSCNAKRMYMSFHMPTLPRNPRIKKAELVLTQNSAYSACNEYPMFGLYHVNSDICIGCCTPVHDSDLIDYARMKTQEGTVTYNFDITTLVDSVNKDEESIQNLVLKMLDETNVCNNYFRLYGSAYGGTVVPQIVITYESSYGVNTSYRTHTHELGRFGKGSIDLQCGNLMIESDDFVWAGNRMPVTVKHLYNSSLGGDTYTQNSAIKLNTANFSVMKLGYGFKLNIMQSMMPATFQNEGTTYTGYVYIGENGEETYFKESEKCVCCNSNSQCYHLYENVNGGDMLYDPMKLTLTQETDIYLFDASGRLIKITDSAGNHIDISFTSNRITSVTDGAGREFGLVYNNTTGQLTSISAPDGTCITYGYTNNLLTSVTYPDGKKAVLAYSSNKPASVTLQDANSVTVYKVTYTFSGNRLASVTEYGSDNAVGAKSTYSYSVASARTLVTTTEQKDTGEGETANNIITTSYTFDDNGNVVSEYVYSTDTGNVGGDGEESGINPHSSDGGAGVVSNINNLLQNHSFEETDMNHWVSMPCNSGSLAVRKYTYEYYAKSGKSVLRMQSYNADCVENGIYQATDSLPAGQYTFSAYLRVLSAFSGGDTPGAFIRVTDTCGNVLGVSEHLVKYDSEYTRLIVPFELDTAQSVQVQILVNGNGTLYSDAVQLESNAYANAYNMLENGNFERGIEDWICTSGVSYSSYIRFNMSKTLCMNGSVGSVRYAYQAPVVCTSRSTRETFTLSGWAKGYGLPNHDRDGISAPQFRLRALVKYYDTVYREYGTEEFTADFSPCTEEWQLASVQFSKSKYRTVEYIRVYCDYSYNSGTVYFDDIQLVRNSLETGLSASDFVVESTGTADDATTEAADTTPTFNEAKDAYGNALTETTFTDGEFGTIYRFFGFNTDDGNMDGNNSGNDLVRETDARGNDTTYAVNGDTSRNEEVTDRLGNKTAYEYDNAGKTTKVISQKPDGTAIANVSYAYDAFDNMTEIARGDGLRYALAYNNFHNLESIGIDGKNENLIQYTYKNGNGRLKQITYANDDYMKANYNSIGQMVSEKWFDSANALTAHYQYVYDGQGNIVRSLDMTAGIEYNYEYEEGRIVRATESEITLSGEIVTAKTLVNTVKYYYDTHGKMTKKVIITATGTAQTIYYETPESESTVVKFAAGGKTVTSHSKTDSFGRKVFDELQLGTGFVSRQFSYHAGQVTDEHKAEGKLKSSATTQLVSQIILSNGTTLSYGYDAEERITSVVETYTVDDTSVTNTTLYTYDALGQLLTETVNGTVVNTMVYDNYGNITTKNGKAYAYDGTWKDLMTSYDGQTIFYDAQGNPTSYLGHTLTWEKGRQLKSFDGNTYTYNANGIRTSKTVNGVTHTYTLDGSKILREVWSDKTLIPLYDNEDGVCGIVYNGEPYYFFKNLQGDIIAIADKNAEVVAKYSYDAWGVCTVTQDITEIGIAIINPFRYRGYYYDQELKMYYILSRYYSSDLGRFVNCDVPELIGLVTILYSINNLNLYTYCLNNPSNDRDIVGWISANQIANMFSISALFAIFLPFLYACYSKGLVAVGAYTTKIVTPIAVKALWWKPWLAAALIISVVAIVIAAIAIYFSKQAKKTAKERSKDAPSWLSSAMNAMPPHWGEKAKDYARRLMDQKYGKGNWSSGPNTEYNKIVKYLIRHVGMS